MLGQANDLLRKAREARGWTQSEIAEKIGCSGVVTVSRWENGITFPSRYFREKLCKLYGKKARELGFERDGEADPCIHKSIFPFNQPLPDAAELYGRRREKETLISRTAHKASTSITGPRRIGKTWLIQHLRLVGPEQLGTRFQIAYLDGMSPQCKTIAGFVTEALNRLGCPDPEVNEGLTSLDKGLRELVSKKLIPVLCIDEFERFSNRPEFTLDFFEGLRAMTHTSDLVLIIASKNPLHLIVGKNPDVSPFFNIFEQLVLKPFTYTEAEQFIRDKGEAAGFTLQERKYLWDYGRVSPAEKAWLPLRLQLAGKILLEDLEQARKDSNYQQSFEKQFEMCYEAVMSKGV